ncbi:MAG: hypothetical protein AAFW84_29840 [Cyanobacteria bacterium J06635_15]
MQFNAWSKPARLAAIALLSVTSLPAFTRGVQAEQIPQVPPELDQLAYFEGTWRCEQPADSLAFESVALTWLVERDLNNFWYVGYAEEMTSISNPNPVNSREFLGYDAAARHFVRMAAVGNGNLLNLTSSGWQGEQLIWEGTVTVEDQAIFLRQIITQESENQFSATYFILDDVSHEWQPVVNETCERQAQAPSAAE